MSCCECKSPCIGVCKINQQTELCVGCYRSREEIANWTHYTLAEGLDVLNKCTARRLNMEGQSENAA